MTSVTSFTSERMLEIENETITDAQLEGNDLVLITREGTEINVGSVRGTTGATGPTGPAGPGGTTGMLGDFPKSPVPAGWLECDGSTQLIASYPALAAYLGTTFGGNGTTTFGLPSYAGQVRVARDISQIEFDTVGETGGEKTHVLTQAEGPIHTHADTLAAPAHTHGMAHVHPSGYGGFIVSDFVTSIGVAAGAGGRAVANTGASSAASTGGATSTTLSGGIANNTPGGGAHNNLQPYRVVVVAIKT